MSKEFPEGVWYDEKMLEPIGYRPKPDFELIEEQIDVISELISTLKTTIRKSKEEMQN